MRIKKQTSKKFSLTNNGALSVFFIGTGSAFAKTLNQNNILIIKGKDHVAVDCGNKCPQALFDYGLNVSEIRNLLITHSHADHIGGLEEVLLFGRYVTKKKPTLIVTEEYQKMLWDESLKGGSAYSEIHDGKPLGFDDFCEALRPKPVEGMPRDTLEIQIGSINLKLPRTMHIPDNTKTWKDSVWSCGVIINDQIFFTSDTRFDPDLIIEFDKKYNFKCIFHDCQFYPGGVHASLDELMTLPKSLKKKIVLMHYGDNWKKMIPKMKQAGFHSFAKQGHQYLF